MASWVILQKFSALLQIILLKNVTGYNTRQVIKIKKNTDNTDWFDGIL